MSETYLHLYQYLCSCIFTLTCVPIPKDPFIDLLIHGSLFKPSDLCMGVIPLSYTCMRDIILLRLQSCRGRWGYLLTGVAKFLTDFHPGNCRRLPTFHFCTRMQKKVELFDLQVPGNYKASNRTE